jgi:glycosyltransferase involved in cell wall biosynthesis
LFGWLLHETQQIVRLTATCDGLTFWPLHHGLTDDALAQNVAHPAARTARLRGRVPAPPTLATPACLRVFAELADGSAHLCFARRVTPAESRPSTEIAAEPEPLPLAQLPMLPSGRPRRLLLVVRTLRPDDASLRALDVAQFLHDNGRWVVRVVATEDGALRDAFEAAACPAQLLDVSRYVNAPPALASAELASLEPQIWWRHLDAVALFDPVSEWAGELAQRHSLPVFRDPPSALAWFAPAADTWRFDALAPVVAPIRGLDGHGAHLLVAATVGRSGLPSVILTDVRDHPDEVLLRAALVQSPGLRAAAWPDALGGLVNPAFGAVPHHRVLTAAAAGVPVITTPTPLLRAAFPAGEVVFLTPGNPLELAHALLDHAANPTAAARRADAARRAVFARHHPAAQLPRWLGALEAAVAAR